MSRPANYNIYLVHSANPEGGEFQKTHIIGKSLTQVTKYCEKHEIDVAAIECVLTNILKI